MQDLLNIHDYTILTLEGILKTPLAGRITKKMHLTKKIAGINGEKALSAPPL
jgi:hypothetical protein